MNLFPATQGISKYYSPKVIVSQNHLGSTKHCKSTFGTYIQAHNKPMPKYDHSAQTLDYIYLHYTNKNQRGQKLFYLTTNQVIMKKRSL